MLGLCLKLFGFTVADLYAIATLPSGSLRLGGASLSSPPPAAIVDALIATTVFATFNLSLRRRNDQLAGGEVWTANFTSFGAITGWFRLLVPGLGVSTAFQISPAALNQAAWHSCRSLYYQRSGLALQPPFANSPWLRPIDHEFSTTGKRPYADSFRDMHISRYFPGYIFIYSSFIYLVYYYLFIYFLLLILFFVYLLYFVFIYCLCTCYKIID
jgi:hypothetical protein